MYNGILQSSWLHQHQLAKEHQLSFNDPAWSSQFQLRKGEDSNPQVYKTLLSNLMSIWIHFVRCPNSIDCWPSNSSIPCSTCSYKMYFIQYLIHCSRNQGSSLSHYQIKHIDMQYYQVNLMSTSSHSCHYYVIVLFFFHIILYMMIQLAYRTAL